MLPFIALVCALVYLLGACVCWRFFRPKWWVLILWPLFSFLQTIELIFMRGDVEDADDEKEGDD